MTTDFIPTDLDIVQDDIFEGSDTEWMDYVSKSKYYLSEKLLEWAENLQQHHLFNKPSDYEWSCPLKRCESIRPDEYKAALREWMDEEAGWRVEPLDHVYPCDVDRPRNRHVHWPNSALTHECETWASDEYDRTMIMISLGVTEEDYEYDPYTQTYMDPYAGVPVGPIATEPVVGGESTSSNTGLYGFFVETETDDSIPRKPVFPKFTGRRNTFMGVPI